VRPINVDIGTIGYETFVFLAILMGQSMLFAQDHNPIAP
jgi:hypothetical protein